MALGLAGLLFLFLLAACFARGLVLWPIRKLAFLAAVPYGVARAASLEPVSTAAATFRGIISAFVLCPVKCC